MDERDLTRALTGMVVAGYGVEPDYENGAVECDRCADDPDARSLTAGDRVVVAVRNYEGHTWEPVGVRCPDHAERTVADAMGVDADDQAVVEGTLEPTGYRDPRGEHHPEALSLGGVEVLDASPAADGY